ncbi:MAG: molybdopterin-binding protein [Chloroflexaceae bacterium]
MEVSARNQIKGTVKELNADQVMAEVVITLSGGTELVSVITAASAKRLNLAVGKEITIIIKSTDVMLASE